MKTSNEINTSEISREGVKAREATRNEVQSNLIPENDKLNKDSETLKDQDLSVQEVKKDQILPGIKNSNGKSKDKFRQYWL